MFTYKIELLENGVWSELDFWVRPFYDTTTLDDTLDTGKIKLSLSTRSKAIKPFTRLRICVYDEDVLVDTIHRIVGSTKKIRRTFPNGKSLFDWEIETVELTKLLERDICDSMTVTNYLAYNYLNNAIVATPYDGTLLDNSGEINPADQFKWEWSWGQLFTPIAFNSEMQVPILQVYYTGSGTTPYPTALYVITPSGTQNEIGNWEGTVPNLYFLPTEKGQHTFVYYDPRYTTNNIYKKFNVEVVEVVQNKTDFTITDVVERLLSAGVTRRSGIDEQKYTFPLSQCEKYASIKAPEFFFTRSTLFEALMQVGNYIHAIPRLVDINNNLYVVFDELGGNTVKEIDMELVYDEQTFAIDDYCGAIDSNVDNLLNSRDKVQGAITEPSTGTYKTVRCEESQVEISADKMIVLTELPIYQVTKLEVSFVKDSVLKEFDITPYLYEAAEYKTLSSYWGSAYPYSKAYALSYTQGDNKITGLNFKQFEPTDIERAWTNYAIRNIIQTVSGIDIESSPVYPNIAFRITYIPMVNARIVQKKSYAGYPLDNTLVHNQNANTVESELYGEKMKGVIARLGNEIIRRTYYFNRYAQLPKCGELVDIDGKLMYVAIVDREFDQRLIKATITFTPNFNKLAEYVGLNSNFRLYDISEKQSVDRYVNYGEYIAIASDGFDFGSPVSPLFRNMEVFAKVFTQITGDHNISAAVTIRADEFGNEFGSKIARPVVSFASGNSLCFAFNYADNFGAGYQSGNSYDNNNKRVQRLVSYTDVYGELESISIEFTSKLWTASAADQTADNGNAQIYPKYTGTPVDCRFNTSGYPLSSKNPLVIQKDSREALSVMIQLHCIALEEDIVIGAALCQNNPLITSTNSAKAAVAYYLPHRINMLNGTIDLTGAIPATYTVYAITDRMSVSMSAAAAQAKSWVLIDPTTNKLILGRNRDFAAGQYDKLWLCSVNGAKMKQLQEEIE